MAVHHQGNANWFVRRERDGSIVWSVRAEQDGKPVVIRGKSTSPSKARGEVSTALFELITMQKRPMRGG